MTKQCKTARPFIPVLLLLLLGMGACRKNADDVLQLVSDSEAAEIVESAIAERTAGATLPTVDMAQILTGVIDQCGVPGDTSFTRSNAIPTASYNYTFGIGWLINCNNLNVPQDATFDVTGNGTFTSTRWNGVDAATGQLVFTGLAPAATEYIANGAYDLSGSVTGNLRHLDPTLSCSVQLTLVNLTISKSGYNITGGTGTAIITVSNANGQSQTIHADLLFNGNGTVTVTVNGYAHTF